MRRKAKPTSDKDIQGFFQKRSQEQGAVVPTSIDELTVKAIEVLRREINGLMAQSQADLLSRDDAMSLTGYIKLLGELKKKELEDLAEADNDKLTKIINDKS